MKIITCTLIDGFYTCGSAPGNNFWILAGFLMSDVSWYAIPSYREFLNDPHEIQTGGNYMMLEKEGSDVLLGCQFDDDFEPCIKMTQKELLSILDQWEALVNQWPKEIIIYKKGESYILEGRNTPSKE